MSNFLIIPQIDQLESSLSLAKEYGFGFEYNDFFFPSVLDDSKLVNELIKKYKSYALPDICTLHGAFFDVLVFSEDKYIRDIAEMRIKQSIATAMEIGAKAVIFHTNLNPLFISKFYLDGWYERNVSFWSRMLTEYSEINIYIENMCDSAPEMLLKLCEELKGFSNFGVCLDYAHASVFGRGEDIDLWVKSLAPYVKHLHINDNDLKYDLHQAIGDGIIDWERFKKYYFDYFSDKTILIETTGMEKQRKSAEYLKNLGIL